MQQKPRQSGDFCWIIKEHYLLSLPISTKSDTLALILETKVLPATVDMSRVALDI